MSKKPIYVIALVFVVLLCSYFLFVPTLNLSNATIEKSETARIRSKKKKCSCCDRLKRFTKEFEERHAKKGD